MVSPAESPSGSCSVKIIPSRVNSARGLVVIPSGGWHWLFSPAESPSGLGLVEFVSSEDYSFPQQQCYFPA